MQREFVRITNYTTNLLKILLFKKIPNEKALQQKAKGLSRSNWLPLLDAFGTFKGDMIIENIRLNQLILQY
jgi:hypothetical protein